jgi:hypothetical protein
MGNTMKITKLPAALSAAGGLMLSVSLLVMAPQVAQATPAGAMTQQLSGSATTGYVTKVYDDDWHNRWRSHRRHASHEDREHNWGYHWGWEHNRWRSHNRHGSEGHDGYGYDHNRWRSHRRHGSEY